MSFDLFILPFCLPHRLSLPAFLFFACFFSSLEFPMWPFQTTSLEWKRKVFCVLFPIRVLLHKDIQKWTVSWGEGVANFPNSVIVILVSKLSRIDSYKMHTLYCRVHRVQGAGDENLQAREYRDSSVSCCAIVTVLSQTKSPSIL